MSDRATLKAFFETGDFPSEAQFDDLIDQTVNIEDDYSQFGKPNYVRRDLTSPEILALNTTPIVLVAAAGVGSAHIPIFTVLLINPGGVAYATFGRLDLRYSTSAETLVGSVTNFLFATANQRQPGILATGSPGDGSIKSNDDLEIIVPNGDPTAGNGIASVIMYYHTLQL